MPIDFSLVERIKREQQALEAHPATASDWEDELREKVRIDNEAHVRAAETREDLARFMADRLEKGSSLRQLATLASKSAQGIQNIVNKVKTQPNAETT